MNKIKFIGFSTDTIAWFRPFLTNRSFKVNIDDTYSEPGDLLCGVPCDVPSILGPLCFLSYANDMPQAVKCEILLYADDTCLVYTHKEVSVIQERLNQDFNELCDWVVYNKLSIHFGKENTKTILFSKRRNKETLEINHGDIQMLQYA